MPPVVRFSVHSIWEVTIQKGARHAARQVFFVMAFLSVLLSAFCLITRKPLLRAIFGAVEADVMRNSQVYFFFTLLSFPFIGLYDAGASIMRAQNNSRNPMVISVISNFMNIGGNAILIFGFGMGVEGAAISTLVSRIFCAIVVIIQLRRENEPIFIKNYMSIRPEWGLIKKILLIGIPSGIENSMFQFGKLAIQSTVSTLGTVAIAAQAMTNILENLNGIAAIGIGIGLMTVVGQCLGAGRKDEAVYYIKKLSLVSEVVIIASCLIIFILTKPITMLAGMEPASARLCFEMITFITIVKPICWVPSFIPPYGLRAAGDVKFTMYVSVISTIAVRLLLSWLLGVALQMGVIGIAIAMVSDWVIRAVIFFWRQKSGKWKTFQVI